MNFSSPDVLKILDQLKIAELVSKVLEWQTNPDGDFQAYESDVRERVMAVERESMALGLKALDVTVRELDIDGRRFHLNPEPSTKTYTCRAGDFSVERHLYGPAEGQGRSLCPLELRAGIVEGTWTPAAAEIMAHGVTVMTPYEAEGLLAKFGGFTPSRSSLDRLPKSLSKVWESNRWDWENILRSQETVQSEAVTVAISLDGIMVPMADGKRTSKCETALKEGKKPSGPNGYREAACGTFCAYDADGERLETIYHGRMPESRKPTLHEQLEGEVSSYLQAAPMVANFVCQSDGALENWRILNSIVDSLREQEVLGPETQVHRIADFFHALEHLKTALDLYYKSNTLKSRAVWQELKLKLLEKKNGVDEVIRKLTYFRNRVSKTRSKTRRKKLTRELAYFRTRKEQMRYAEFVEKGLPIGTGVTEAACKTLVTQRLKRSGMRWAILGGQGVLTLRSLLQSKRWDRGWELLTGSYRPKILMVTRVRHLELLQDLQSAA